MVKGSLGERFANAPNALNAVRLCLALGVVLWHSYKLAGDTWLPLPVERFLSDIFVDSFFAISGFLICRAWHRRPDLATYASARARRLLPGLWVCLVVTAFVIAPLASWAGGVAQPSRHGQVGYVLGNATTWVHAWGIDGGPFGVTFQGAWDGSLWSLGYESSCYIALAALGVLGLLRPRVIAAVTLSFWTLSVTVWAAGAPGLLVPRTGLMFCCGALLWVHRDRVPVSRLLAGLCMAMIGVGALTPNYRLVAAPAVAYLCVYVAVVLGRHRRLVLQNDISYGVYIYSFPLQQAFLVAGFSGSWPGFVLVSASATIPIAALSWFLVERPALRLQPRGRRSSPSLRALPAVAAHIGPEGIESDVPHGR